MIDAGRRARDRRHRDRARGAERLGRSVRLARDRARPAVRGRRLHRPSTTGLGTVERTGFKTTRLRSLSGEELVCSNTDLLSSADPQLQTDGRAPRRLFDLRSGTSTTADRLERLLGDPARDRRGPEARSGSSAPTSKSSGDTALIFEVVYWMLDPRLPPLHGRAAGDQPRDLAPASGRRGSSSPIPTQTILLEEFARSDGARAAAVSRASGGNGTLRILLDPTLAGGRA